MGAGKAKACVISYSSADDAPCGQFSGTSGATHGASPLGTDYAISLQSTSLQEAIETNWERLSTLSEASLCCASDDAISAGAAGCHMGTVQMMSQNPCNAGEYNIKCYGAATAGLCMVYNNVTDTSDIGQYYVVNLADDVPRPSATGSASQSTPSSQPSTTSSGTGAGATTPTTPEYPGDEKTSGPNLIAIIVPVVIGVLLIALAILFFLRRRRQQQLDKASSTPTPFGGPTQYVGTAAPSVMMSDISMSHMAGRGQDTTMDPGSTMPSWSGSTPPAWSGSSSQTQLLSFNMAGGNSLGPATAPAMPPTTMQGKRAAAAAATSRAHEAELPPYSPAAPGH